MGAVSTWNHKVAIEFAYGMALVTAIALDAHATPARAAEPANPAAAENAGKGKSDLEWEPVHSAHALIGAVVKTHGGDIVVATRPGTPPALSSPSDPEGMSRVVLFSTLGDIPVHNARGDKLGSINDFGIARKRGQIMYAVMVLDAEASTADTLYPIPLAAFVVRAHTKQWIMELPEGILENTPTMKKSQWPTTVPLAWSEYVSVRSRKRAASPFHPQRRPPLLGPAGAPATASYGMHVELADAGHFDCSSTGRRCRRQRKSSCGSEERKPPPFS